MNKKLLGEICKIVSGGTPSRGKPEYWLNGTIPWIKIGNIKSKYVKEADEYITKVGLDNSAAKMLPRGTILYTIFATLGEVGILAVEACTNQAIVGITIIDSDVLLTDYLYYYLKSKKTYVNDIGRGVAQNNINISILKNLEILIPAVQDQKEIITILDKCSRIITDRKEQLQKLDNLIKARFVEMFGDLKTNNKRWPIENFNAFACIDTRMIHDFEGYEDYPHIGIDSIEKDTGRISGYRTVREDGVISGKYLFSQEHIIYSKIRPNLNKVALPDFVGVCSADAYPILAQKDKCNRLYLANVLRSPVFLDYILAFSNRTNLPKVNKQQVEGFSCPLPPISLQDKFSSFVKQIDKSKFVVQQALDKAQLLFDSLMQKYFG